MSSTHVSVNETTPLPQVPDSSIQSSTPSPMPDIVCPRCGAKIKKRNGTKKTEAGTFQRYTCVNGHNFIDDSKPIN